MFNLVTLGEVYTVRVTFRVGNWDELLEKRAREKMTKHCHSIDTTIT